MKLTANGVCYDLKETPFQYERFGMVYCFSSRTHQEKFAREYRKREEWLSDSLSRRFKIKFDADMLADIQLYQMIEKRGFYVFDMEGDAYECPEDMEYLGHPVKLKGLEKQSSSTTEVLIG